MSNAFWASSMEHVYAEFIRVMLLSSLYTLAPLAAVSFLLAILQALLQIQDSVSPQVIKLLSLYLIIFLGGNQLIDLWQGLIEVFVEVSLRETPDAR